MRLAVEPLGPAEGFRKRIGRRPCEYRYRQQADPDDPHGKEQEAQIPGNRAQRAGSLIGRGDLVDPVRMKRRCRGDHNDQRRHARYPHAEQRVGAHA